MRQSRHILIAGMVVLLLAALIPFVYGLLNQRPAEPFVVSPYLQMGNRPLLSSQEELTVSWITPANDADWLVDVRSLADSKWRRAKAPVITRINLPFLPPLRLYSAALQDLVAGQTFTYRIIREGRTVFVARGTAKKSVTQPYRFVVFGDLAAGTSSQRRIAYQTYRARPDFVCLTGDIVYRLGRFSEYLTKYFPVYNADEPSAASGAPLIRSTLFVAAPGNHDIGSTNWGTGRNLNLFPDAMAYFYLWNQPLNGPRSTVGMPNTAQLTSSPERRSQFLAAAGLRYPRMTNFSFYYGNSHWTVLDGNDYVDWTDPSLRQWLQKDLQSAGDAIWRFVAFHQSPFSSGASHFSEQRMRLLADIFEKGRVDVVFTGHQHNYQRTFPLCFRVLAQPDGRLISGRGQVEGTISLDRNFDGLTRRQPHGVIYVITGAGGAALASTAIQYDRALWQPYTQRLISDRHSLTVCDVDGDLLTVRQISDDGIQLDRFAISKSVKALTPVPQPIPNAVKTPAAKQP